jgi:hypothetical protein
MMAHLSLSEDSASSPRSVMSMKGPQTTKARRIGPQNIKARRGVSFAPQVETLLVVERLCDLPEGEIAATWYDRDEYCEIKKSLSPTVKKMHKGLPLDSDDDESRGLEYRTRAGAQRRQKNKLHSIDAVLDEQERQWEESRSDPTYIAEIYSQATAHCLMGAYLAAKADSEFVQKQIQLDAESNEADATFEFDTPAIILSTIAELNDSGLDNVVLDEIKSFSIACAVSS